MGRGGRAHLPLALASIVAPPESPWVVSFRTLEQSDFHPLGEVGCDFSHPYGEPRFVVIDAEDKSGQEILPTHNFSYYETPGALLESLVVSLRLPKSHAKFAFEYQPRDSSFDYVTFSGGGLILGYTPPKVPPAKDRSARARSVVDANPAEPLVDYKLVTRFLLLKKRCGHFIL